MRTPFSAALKAAVSGSGRSLQMLSRELAGRGTPASVSTLSSWQTGENHPERAGSLAALANLEQLLGVPPGALLPPRRPRGRWRPPGSIGLPHQRMWRSPAAVDRVLAELDATADDMFTPLRVSYGATTVLDARGAESEIHHRQLLLGDRDRCDRLITVMRYDAMPQPPTVGDLEGCLPGRSRVDVPALLHAVELRLDPPLRRDQLRLVEYTVRLPPGQTDQHTTHRIQPGVRDATVRVRFHPARLPARCAGFYLSTRGGVEQPVPGGVLVGTTYQLVLLDPAPGIYGLRWDWPEE
ncbi:MAG: hypothetical protein ACRDT6_22865 [Micromonosporaceae bacterium]